MADDTVIANAPAPVEAVEAPAALPAPVTPVASNYSGAYFNLFGDEPAVPDANELLSLKILKEANPQAFAHLAAEETKWLSLALGLLRRDVYLQVQMGGKGVRQAIKLANVLKNKAEQSHFNHRLNGVIERMITTKFIEDGWNGLAPVTSSKISEFMNLTNQGQIAIQPMNNSTMVYGNNVQQTDIDGDIPMMGSVLNQGIASGDAAARIAAKFKR